MTTIWLDVTTLMQWTRAAVGVVRVETECAKFALGAGSGFRFCIFDRAAGYRVVDAETVQDKIRALEAPAVRPVAAASTPASSPAAPVAAPALSRASRYRLAALRLVNRLPPRYAGAIHRQARSRKEPLRRIWIGLAEIRNGIKGLLGSTPPLGQARHHAVSEAAARADTLRDLDRAIPFTEGDVYLSLGLDWDQKDLTFLYQQKKRLGFKVVLFCYDVIPVKFPHLCVGDVASLFARYFVDVAWCADRVLCISKQSESDLSGLLTELGAPVPPMEVVTLGCNVTSGAAPAEPSAFAAETGERFILYVSTIERRKNHVTLYQAYARLADEGLTDLPKLVFVGMRGWGVNDLFADLAFDPRVQRAIVTLHDVSDAELSKLYDRAFFTVFPSLYEGWGLAVAESLARGKLCLAANVASLPEVGGNFADYLDPLDVPAWAARLRLYIENPQIVDERNRGIKAGYKPLEWSRASAAIMGHATAMAVSR